MTIFLVWWSRPTVVVFLTDGICPQQLEEVLVQCIIGRIQLFLSAFA
jgi:hypothetical protein